MLGAPCPGPLAPEGLSPDPARLSGGQLHPAHSATPLCPASRSKRTGLGLTLSDVMAVRSTLALQHIHTLILVQYRNSDTLSSESQCRIVPEVHQYFRGTHYIQLQYCRVISTLCLMPAPCRFSALLAFHH